MATGRVECQRMRLVRLALRRGNGSTRGSKSRGRPRGRRRRSRGARSRRSARVRKRTQTSERGEPQVPYTDVEGNRFHATTHVESTRTPRFACLSRAVGVTPREPDRSRCAPRGACEHRAEPPRPPRANRTSGHSRRHDGSPHGHGMREPSRRGRHVTECVPIRTPRRETALPSAPGQRRRYPSRRMRDTR